MLLEKFLRVRNISYKVAHNIRLGFKILNPYTLLSTIRRTCFGTVPEQMKCECEPEALQSGMVKVKVLIEKVLRRNV